VGWPATGTVKGGALGKNRTLVDERPAALVGGEGDAVWDGCGGEGISGVFGFLGKNN